MEQGGTKSERSVGKSRCSTCHLHGWCFRGAPLSPRSWSPCDCESDSCMRKGGKRTEGGFSRMWSLGEELAVFPHTIARRTPEVDFCESSIEDVATGVGSNHLVEWKSLHHAIGFDTAVSSNGSWWSCSSEIQHCRHISCTRGRLHGYQCCMPRVLHHSPPPTWSARLGPADPLLEDAFSVFSLSTRKGSCLRQQNREYSLAKPSKHDFSLSQLICKEDRCLDFGNVSLEHSIAKTPTQHHIPLVVQIVYLCCHS